jgi:hypothetical protein
MIQIAAGVFGFVLNIATFWQIKYTSSLTHNLVGTLKSCGQTIVAIFLFPEYEQFTVLKTMGVVIVVISSIVYGIFKHQETVELEKGLPDANAGPGSPKERKARGMEDADPEEKVIAASIIY